mgnify:CR=1 FL=1
MVLQKDHLNMYTPLPSCLTIKQSSIHGLGLFATEKINEGTDLGRSHFASDQQQELIRTPIGGFVNHSDNSNVKIEQEKGTDFFRLMVTRTIYPGDEITGYYMNTTYMSHGREK